MIVFVGYRFPQSDSHARSEILGAIAANDAPYLRVHTVLGPNLHEPDTVRLANLLHHALRRSGKKQHGEPQKIVDRAALREQPLYDLITQPLYAEDFLSVADEVELLGPDPKAVYRVTPTIPVPPEKAAELLEVLKRTMQGGKRSRSRR